MCAIRPAAAIRREPRRMRHLVKLRQMQLAEQGGL